MRWAASKLSIFLGLLLASLATPASGKGIVVKPARLEIAFAADGARSGRLTVAGTTPEKTRVRVRVEDFILGEDGQPQRAPGIAGDRSAASQVLVDPDDFTLEGGREETVLVRYTPHPESGGPHWALLVFDVEGTPATESGGRRTLVASRVLVPLFANGAGTPRREVRVSDLTGEKPSAGPCQARALLENSGEAVLEPVAEWVLFRRLGGKTEELGRWASASVLLLPGGRRRLQTSFDCSAGPYEGLGVYLSVRYGDGSGERAEAAAPLAPGEGGPAKN